MMLMMMVIQVNAGELRGVHTVLPDYCGGRKTWLIEGGGTFRECTITAVKETVYMFIGNNNLCIMIDNNI
jgi:hypothetical protein